MIDHGPAGVFPRGGRGVLGEGGVLYADGEVVHDLAGQDGDVEGQGGDLPAHPDLGGQINGLSSRVLIARGQGQNPIAGPGPDGDFGGVSGEGQDKERDQGGSQENAPEKYFHWLAPWGPWPR